MTGGQVIFQTTALPNTAVTVTVADYNGQQLANELAALVNEYGQALANPVTTDALGNLVFYTVPGWYTLTFEANDATVTQGVLVGGPVGAGQFFDVWGG